VDEVEEEIRRLAEETYRMFRERDPGFLDRVDPEVDWHVSDTLPDGGDLHGIPAVMDHLEAIEDNFEGLPEPEEFIGFGDRVLVLGTWRGRARETGVALEVPFAQLGRWRDGRLIEFRNYVDSAKMLRALEPNGT
jgi:ketosteroid isomerase-like protein